MGIPLTSTHPWAHPLCLLPARAASFLVVLLYLLLIFVGQNYMKARKGFSLRGPLILWSFCLAVFR